MFACRRLCVSFPVSDGRVDVLRDVSIEVRRGEFVSIVGPSGCGKTTLLRTILGMVRPDTGSIQCEVFQNSGRCLMVHQENSLFPWMSVLDNACFGLEAQGVSREKRESQALRLMRRFGLEGRERAWPHQLSLGMKQRVAVIRSFLSNPDLLLMDEPFAALDCQMRLTLQRDLLELWDQDQKTVVFVTHDVEEAILLSDRVLVLSPSPGTVVSEVPVSFARPRDVGLALTEEFLRIKREISRHLHIHQREPAYAQ